MLKPLEQWICDDCGELIESHDKGIVVWQQDFQTEVYLHWGYRVIHKRGQPNQEGCDGPAYRGWPWLDIGNLTGIEGLTRILAMQTLGPLKEKLEGPCKIGPKHSGELVDLIRRMQTPYYEEARTRFNNRDLMDWFSDNNEVAPYLPETLQQMIKDYPISS